MKSRITCLILPSPAMSVKLCLVGVMIILLSLPSGWLYAQTDKKPVDGTSQKIEEKEAQQQTQKKVGDAQLSPEAGGAADNDKTVEADKKGNQNGLENMPDMSMEDSVSLLKTFMALTFVLGLIFFSAYLFKRLTGVKGTGIRTNKIPIHVVGNMPMGDKKFLTIVEIQGKHYFLGITQNSIAMLSKLDLDVPEVLPDEGNAGDFESIFKKARELLQNKGKK